MRKWVIWCIEHRMKWFVFVVLFLISPIYFAAGAFVGAKEAAKDWKSDFLALKKAIKKGAA